MSLSRRGFIKSTAIGGGGIALGFTLTGCGGGDTPLPHADPTSLQPNAFLEVLPNGKVVLQLHKAEMGQGVYTGMATLVGEELNLNPKMIKVEHAYFHPDLVPGQPAGMITGGSNSLSMGMEDVRTAAASMRAILIEAAKKQSGNSGATFELDDGVVQSASGQRYTFAELVSAAQSIPVPESVTLKAAKDFRYIGKPSVREDALAKVTGTATYGVDVRNIDALTAVLVRCPHIGGSLKSWDAKAASTVPGVVKIVEVAGGVAIAADNYWTARRAADRLNVVWDKGPLAGVSDADLRKAATRLAEKALPLPAGEPGVVSAEYTAPYLAHSAMEPLSAMVAIKDNRVDIWCGTQAVDPAIGAVARVLNRPKTQIHIHNHHIGGGFGRRLSLDFLEEAALIAQALGEPVRVQWSREDDMRHDQYRPMSQARFKASLSDGNISALKSAVVCPSLVRAALPDNISPLAPTWFPESLISGAASLMSGFDPLVVEGIKDMPYNFGEFELEYEDHKSGVPVSFWRSVGHSCNGFFMECFVDELALAVQQDPVEFRRAHLPEHVPQRTVLNVLAERAKWGSPPEGFSQGIAVHRSFGTTVGEVVNARVNNGRIEVHSVVCVVDCGMAVNPDTVKAQMEGGINFALTAALYGEINIDDGAVRQSNFHDYQMLRMHESPEIDVHILPSSESPTGVGEPGVPPLAAALGNAIYANTGKRLRSLPFRPS